MSRMNESMGQSQSGGSTGSTGSTTEQLKDKASEVGQNLREMGGQARDAAREQYENLRDQASEYYEAGRQRAQEWEQNLENYVQEQPVKSLLIAAGVGFLLGAIWKRS